MSHFKVKKVLTAYWSAIEAESVTQAAFKARKLVPDRQIVHESHIVRKEKKGGRNNTN